MSDHYDPFAPPPDPPQANLFEPPQHPELYQPPARPEPYAPPEYAAPEYAKSDYLVPDYTVTDPMPTADALASPEPLVSTEPVPALAGGITAPAETRLAIDGGSLSMERVVEEIIAWLKTLASAAVYATLIVTFGFQVARVEGHSMAPTLADQDRLIVNKFAYRVGEPQIGDIVMLYYPLLPEKSFVKRVIAAEGDQVRIVDGKVYRNDVLMDDSFVPPEYKSHDDWGPQVIPEGYYFVMGDHRNNSSDSRHWGFVPKKYIIGRVQLRWWPLQTARMF